MLLDLFVRITKNKWVEFVTLSENNFGKT